MDKIRGTVVRIVDFQSDRLLLEVFTDGMPGIGQMFLITPYSEMDGQMNYLKLEELKPKEL